MARSFQILTGLVVLFAAWSIGRSQAAAQSLKNPGFEEGPSSAFPQDWTQEDKLRSRGHASVEPRPDGQGRALRLQPNRNNKNPNEPYGVAQVLKAGDVGSGSLRISASILGSGGAAPVLLALPMTRDMRPIAVIDVPAGSGSSFSTVSREFPIGQAVYLVIACVVGGQKGEAWFDDIRLESAGASASSLSAARATATGASASITVDPGRVLRDVPRGIFGANVEWIYNANGLWDARKRELNPSVIATARKAGISTLRFPGGVFADYYHWRDGIGPIESRPARQHSPSDKNVSPNSVGTHEMAELARAIGAELMLQVNIATGTPEEAAEWVRYCNAPDHPERARNGSPQPFKVRYWEIGNESYMRGESEATRKAFLSPREYAERFLKFAEAMKRADPTIQIGAIGGRNFGKYGFVTDQNWNSTVLSRAGRQIDFYAVHNAYAPVAASQSHLPAEDVYRAMFAFPKQVERNLEDLDREIEVSPGRGHTRIAVTEWGPYFHVIPTDPYIDHVKTLGSAIYTAETLATFLRNPEMELANFFKLTDVAWLGWIGLDGTPKPSLLALELFARHFGARLVDTSTTGPTYDAPQAGMVASERDVPSLSAVASLSGDGSRLYVLTINKSLTDTIEADLNIRGERPKQNVNTWTLTGGAVDANNGHRLPEIPGARWGTPAKAARGSQFDAGRPGSVDIRQASLRIAGGSTRVRLAPLSVTSFELQLR